MVQSYHLAEFLSTDSHIILYPFSYGWEKTLLVQPAVAPEAQLPLVTEWLHHSPAHRKHIQDVS